MMWTMSQQPSSRQRSLHCRAKDITESRNRKIRSGAMTKDPPREVLTRKLLLLENPESHQGFPHQDFSRGTQNPSKLIISILGGNMRHSPIKKQDNEDIPSRFGLVIVSPSRKPEPDELCVVVDLPLSRQVPTEHEQVEAAAHRQVVRTAQQELVRVRPIV